jgi:hypothetical protein
MELKKELIETRKKLKEVEDKFNKIKVRDKCTLKGTINNSRKKKRPLVERP